MGNHQLVLTSIEQLPEAAKQILEFTEERKVFAFYAEMGAGKTTLIKELCCQLGSHDSFSSPTYSIVNEYAAADSKIYHIDLYRIKNIQEAMDAGIDDYLSGTNYCFIEWAELIENMLPDDVVKIHIQSDGNVRNVSIFIR